jgi:hypothetical protein
MVLFKNYCPRLRAAKVDGFESINKITMKLNAKRLENGLEEINLEESCKDDLK